MNILITGANGFIGSNVFNKLSTISNINLYKGTKESVNLLCDKSVENYIHQNKIDGVIHCAIQGGNRLQEDSSEDFYKNILMYENLIKHKSNYKLFINIASGAEYDRRYDINNKREEDIYNSVPVDFYGLSKNIISKSLKSFNHGINLRLFGCFCHNELSTRFVKNNIINYINKKEIIIHQDRYIDYIYIEDVLEVILHYINNLPQKFIDINLCYPEKYKLSDISLLINDLSTYKVDIIVENRSIGLSYTGNSDSFSKLNLNFKGLQQGIKETYDVCKQNLH